MFFKFTYFNLDWFHLPGFTFLVLPQPGSPGQIQEGRKTAVCVYVTYFK